MPLFSYEAADTAGKKIKDSAEAADEAALKGELQRRGLFPLSIKVVERRRILAFERATKKDLLLFTRELGNLLEAGLPIDRALYVLSEHNEKEAMRAILRQICIDIQKGQSLSQSLSEHRMFPKVYVNMIKAGEVGGILEQVLKRLSAFLETTAAFREDIISALVYPALLTTVGGFAVIILMFYVVPKFAVIFEDMGQALPAATIVLLGLSGWLTSYWWAAFAAIAAGALLLISYSRTSEGRLFIHGMTLKIPVVRGIHLNLIIARFTRTLGTLLQSGVPVLAAIKVSREVIGNEVIDRQISGLEEGVRKGRGMSAPFRESGILPPVVAEMIAVGEEAGKVEETLLMVAERFEAESRSLIKRTISLFEPSLILLMGVIVGFIVISMLVAVFSIHDIPF